MSIKLNGLDIEQVTKYTMKSPSGLLRSPAR